MFQSAMKHRGALPPVGTDTYVVMNNQIYTPKQDYKVLCLCKTFNQSKYIEDTLNGFAMQKTDFQFVCLVIDDCSTDGEQEVIRVWLDRECDMLKAQYIDIPASNIIIVKHKKNHNCNYAIYFLKKNLYQERAKKERIFMPWRDHCEYEALCEGDDYWIDPLKLKKQVESLDENKDVAMVYTIAKRYSQKEGLFVGEMGGQTSFFDLLCDFNNAIPTPSVMYRKQIYNQYKKNICPDLQNWKLGDYPFNLYVFFNHKVKMLNSGSVVYRLVENSTSHNLNEEKLLPYYKSIFDIKKFFYEKTDCNNNLRIRMCKHFLVFLYRLYERLPIDETKQLLNDVYSYMKTDSLFEKMIYKILTNSRVNKQFRIIIRKLYLRLNDYYKNY